MNIDNRPKPPSQQKLAEKLIILNERAQGLLTRLHYSKQSCEEGRTCPPCLTEKTFDGVVKTITSKFPKLDRARSSIQNMNLSNSTKNDMRQHLQVHYNTFVDILELKEYVMELLTNISVEAMSFDIRINFSLTANFLDILCRYVKMIILLGKHEHVKAIIGIYNIIYDPQCGEQDPSRDFHRLGNLVESCDTPLKKLVDEILPLSLRVGLALKSLHNLHTEKNLHINEMRDHSVYKLISQNGLSAEPVVAPDPGCKMISLEKLNEWILYGYLVCPSQLNSSDQKAWKNALSDSYIVTLFRDEVVNIHAMYIDVFERYKGHRKLVQMVQEAAVSFAKDTYLKHQGRRSYLRLMLSEMINIVTSSPGLIAPKLLLLLDAMSAATGEVLWLVRNFATDWRKYRVKVTQDNFNDPLMAQLLHGIDTLSRLIKTYHPIIKRYFLQYLKQNDCIELRHIIQNFPAPEEESLLLTSFIDKLGGLDINNLEAVEDFKPLRIDWQRLQAYTNVSQSQLQLKQHEGLAICMNTIEYHTRCVDSMDILLKEVTDLSNLCFYQKFIQDSFQKCLERSDTAPYSVVYAGVCSHFINTCNDYCPEEHCFIGKKSIDLANHFLDMTAREAQRYLEHYCVERLQMHMLTHPSFGAQLMAEARNNKEREAKKERPAPPIPLPGAESKKSRLEDMTQMDKNFAKMVSHLQALNTLPNLVVWQHTFAPREYIIHHLDELFNRLISQHIYQDGGGPVQKQIQLPSIMSHRLVGLMDVFRQLESYITLDTSRIFNVILLQHTQVYYKPSQPEENTPGPTLASQYTEWYLDKLEEHIKSGEVCYAPLRKCFVRKHQMAPNFNAELYTNIAELQALAKMLGPYGIKFLGEKLMERCERHVHEMLSIVQENKELLIQLRACTMDQFPTAMISKQLKRHEIFLSHCIVVGALFNFRRLTVSALKSVVEKRAPFLQKCILDYKTNIRPDIDPVIPDEMATAAGFEVDADPALCAAIQKHCTNASSETLWTLFNVMVAVTLPLQSLDVNSVYRTPIEGHENNLHCVSTAVTWLSACVYTNLVRSGLEKEPLQVVLKEGMREFLEKVSERMLKLQLEEDKELQKEIKQRDSLFILLEKMVRDSNFITYDMLENNFPFTILRNSFRAVYENKKKKQQKNENEI
ncbi:hypothetical protein ACHWQZ_G007307 [Mnemiopsis leidyi]